MHRLAHLAPTVTAPRLGLPATWPVIDTTEDRTADGIRMLLVPVDRYHRLR